MMNEKTINEQYAYIRTLLEEKRLKEALMQLESLLWQCPRLGSTHSPGTIADFLQIYAGIHETGSK